jgi:phosphoglycolate phosphatase-like HAD superfamily hydrolase
MKLVILDKDGPIVDSLTPFYNSTVAIFRHYGLEPPKLDDYRDNITPDFMQFYWDRGIPLYVTARELNHVRMECCKEEWTSVRLQPGAKELLKHCHELGFSIFLATADTYENAAQHLQELGVRELIDGWARNGNLRREDLLDILAFADGFSDDEPWEVWYIDDTASGIAAAKDLPLEGIHTIGFTGGFNSPKKFKELPEDHAPDHTVASLFDIPAILDAYAIIEKDPAMHRRWSVN